MTEKRGQDGTLKGYPYVDSSGVFRHNKKEGRRKISCNVSFTVYYFSCGGSLSRKIASTN